MFAKYSPIDDPRKAPQKSAGRIRRDGEDVNRAGEVSYTLIKRPNALEYACLNIWRANRRSVFESEFVSSTQVIEESDAADKPDTVLETEEGRIHNRWRGHEIVGRGAVGG